MQSFVSRRPLAFVWLLNLALLPLTPVLLLMLKLKPDWMPLESMQMLSQGLVLTLPTLLLTLALGWWKEIGLGWKASWKGWHLLWFVPVMFIVGVAAVGIPPKSPAVVVSLLLLTLFIGFQEEVIWRGMIVKALRPTGIMPTVLWSAFFFGIIHFNTILVGASPAYSLLQVVASFLGGIGMAAIRLRMESLWPMILAHALNDFAMFITRSEVVVTTAPPAWLVAAKTLLPLFICFYGLYLLRDEWLPGRRRKVAVQ